MTKKVVVIGGGISGLASACYLSKFGYKVTVLEKNSTLGGRARYFCANGFVYDMGPSWYWMPDVFENFFNDFNYSTHHFYNLIRLNPAFQIIFDTHKMSIPSELKGIAELIDTYEENGKQKFLDYIKYAQHLYEKSMHAMVYKPFVSVTEFFDRQVLDWTLIKSLFSTISKDIRKTFKHPSVRQLLEFPVIFLGESAERIPALYHLMNYSAFAQGTWYPMGGMYQIINAIHTLAQKMNVSIFTHTEVQKIVTRHNKVIGVQTSNGFIETDILLSSADYAFTETLLDEAYRNYSNKYWQTRTFAPSALIYYLGVDKKIPSLQHHNLFFDADFDTHIQSVYITHQYPTNPLFYLSVPSVTDSMVAPVGKENFFILIPLSVNLLEDEYIQENLLNNAIQRIEKFTQTDIKNSIVFKLKYSRNDFIRDYNAYKGNAYGLANTLMQTAIFKPKMINKKISNLFYTGQLTVPGPGVPPSLISAKIIANLIHFKFPIQKNYYYEYETHV